MRDGTGVSLVFMYGIGGAVTIVFIASVIAAMIDHTYSTPTGLYGLEGIIVGAVFGDLGLRRARRKLNEQEPDQ